MSDYRLQVVVDSPADLERVVEFFEGSAYLPDALDERTVALVPPPGVRFDLARREVEIYLRVLRRVHQGIGASIAA